jgi:hypothetical protein
MITVIKSTVVGEEIPSTSVGPDGSASVGQRPAGERHRD